MENIVYNILGKSYTGLRKVTNICDKLYYSSYVHGFPSLEGFTDDCGWGCTIRSTQMMLGNSVKKFLKDEKFEKIYSLHNIVQKSGKYGGIAGEWFSPSVVAQTVRDISIEEHLPFSICFHNSKNITSFPSLVLLSTRLGIDKFDTQYIQEVHKAVAQPTFCGIVGGKRSSSYFFIGTNNIDRLLYLDPHTVQKADHTEKIRAKPKFLSFRKLDPCMLFCWLCNNEKDVDDLREKCSFLFDTFENYFEEQEVTTVDSDDILDCVLVD